MDISLFTLRLALLFFPGLICAAILDLFTLHRPRENFTFMLQSFVFGLLSYSGLVLAKSSWALTLRICPWISLAPPQPSLAFFTALGNSTASIDYSEIMWATVVSAALGIFLTMAMNHKWHYRILQRIGVTRKTAELDIWGYFFNMKEVNWVTVRDHSNDLVYDGWVQSFSDDSKEAELVLRDVSVYRNSTSDLLYQVGMMYLSRGREDLAIEVRSLKITPAFDRLASDGNTGKERGNERSAKGKASGD